jgi:acetyl esterase/lipase
MLKKLIGLVAILAVLGIGAWHLSPWPSALFYRYVLDKAGIAANDALAKHVPQGVTARHDLAYGPEPIEKLDVYLPSGIEGSARRLPLIFWIHGGGFLAGDKNHQANYMQILAAKGYAVVAIDYLLAPAAHYPVPTFEANAALAFVKANAATLNIDSERIILAGDSAGAQIAAQLAIAISDPAYAQALGLTLAIQRPALRGVLLYCGIYDPDSLKAEGPMGGFLAAVAWSYFGLRTLDPAALPRQFSIVRNVTAALPPLFISAGNGDPLLPHSETLAEAARKMGVTVDALFFPDDTTPPLPHEYQFDLDTAAGQLALERSLAFIAGRTQ